MPFNRRNVGPGVSVVPALFLVGAIVAFVIEGATWEQVVVPAGVAVALGVTVSVVVSRTRRFRGGVVLVGWLAAAFGSAALAADPTVEPVAGALLYVPAMLWSSLFFDIEPETFRGDEQPRGSDRGAAG